MPEMLICKRCGRATTELEKSLRAYNTNRCGHCGHDEFRKPGESAKPAPKKEE